MPNLKYIYIFGKDRFLKEILFIACFIYCLFNANQRRLWDFRNPWCWTQLTTCWQLQSLLYPCLMVWDSCLRSQGFLLDSSCCPATQPWGSCSACVLKAMFSQRVRLWDARRFLLVGKLFSAWKGKAPWCKKHVFCKVFPSKTVN